MNLSNKKINFENNYYYKIIQKIFKGADIEINGVRSWDIHIKNPDYFKRLLQKGSLGLGESYMENWWECERLDIFFYHIFKYKLNKKLPYRLKDIIHIILTYFNNFQSKKRAWIIGKKHYDLGNELFFLMLDPYMQYSCGYWKAAKTLEEAQRAKMDIICQKLQLKKGMSLLDIGCGWGGLAAYAAENYGVKVHGITISKNQQKFAQKRCTNLDVKILLQDYRDILDKEFDRIVSVGMFEHVGKKNYTTFFKIIDRNLKSNGLFLLQTIGIIKSSIFTDPWINTYIFPNAHLPSMTQIARANESHFIIEDWHNFSADYDTTLMAWQNRFRKKWKKLSKNYDERFKRMFIYYLNACSGAFRARELQLWQILFSRGVKGGIQSIR